MNFRVLLHPGAAKALTKIDEANRTRIKKALQELSQDPSKTGKPLHPSNYWSLRVGDYRAIYEIDTEQNCVIVLFIGHRKKVYEDFSKIL